MFVLPDLESGGAQRVVLTVVAHLNRAVFEPHLSVCDSSGPLLKELPHNAAIHELGRTRVRYALPALHQVIRRVRPHVVVSTLGHLNLVLLASRRLLPSGTKLLVREANTPSIRLAQTSHPCLYRSGFRLLYPRADRVLCGSFFMKKDLIRHFALPPARVSVVPNPVDTEHIRARTTAATSPYRDGGTHIVSVGRLNRQKGYDLLFRALKRARSRVPELRFFLVGDGPEKATLEALSRKLGLKDAVTFLGHRNNPYPFVSHADIFVSSSRYEGSPNVVLESLVCGTPVLAFDCPGGTREILTEGINGWLVPAEDTVAMAEKLIHIIRDRAWENLDSKHLLPPPYECGNAVRAYESLLLECAGGM